MTEPASSRELVVLGTASQVPTATRNHNAYVVRLDDVQVLFDPGEGCQRQMTFAHLAAARLSAVCVTHLHGDHCLGLPGVLQRRMLDTPGRSALPVWFPAAGVAEMGHLLHCCAVDSQLPVTLHPVDTDGEVGAIGPYRLVARALDHSVPAVGWRLEGPEERHLLADRLAEAGLEGAAIGRLRAGGEVVAPGGRAVRLDDVSITGPGVRVAVVLDTRLCDAAYELARDADLLVIEATYLEAERALAEAYGHLTVAQAASIARDAGAHQVVLSHFSSRYHDPAPLREEARAVFPGAIVAADLDRVAITHRVLPRR